MKIEQFVKSVKEQMNLKPAKQSSSDSKGSVSYRSIVDQSKTMELFTVCGLPLVDARQKETPNEVE
jgi:hypothetical protein